MKVKVAELIGNALDYVVATAIGVVWRGDWYKPNDEAQFKLAHWPSGEQSVHKLDGTSFSPSTNWEQGGPIIEREIYEVLRCGGTGLATYFECGAGFEDDEDYVIASGPTILIAAMRCFVTRKHGSEVEIPEELL